MKKNVVVIFGGDSSEHDISCLSAQTVINNMDREKYNVIKVGITKEGKWLLVDHVKDIEDGSWREGEVRALISPDTDSRSLIILAEGTYKMQKVDVIFPVLHGMNGEDGTIQGLFELSKIPYVGCGVLSSAVSMDKVYTKIIVDRLGIDQAKFVHVTERDFTDDDLTESKTVIDPDMPQEIKEQIRKDALEIFHAVDGFGCARVDFFLEESGRVVFNEINTMPGFTSISMYPMLWKACGIDTPQLIDRLLDLAMTRYR